jgi:predicted transcriptional regulator
MSWLAVELRRRAPRCSTDFWIALYATSPERAVLGGVRAREVIVASPDDLWRQVEDGCGLRGDEYRRYYDGATHAVGIRVEDPITFSSPLKLDWLRSSWPTFTPPRSFTYLSKERIQDLGDHAGLCFLA